MPETKREVKPKLRFSEFQDLLEWEEKKLLDICEINPSNEGLPESFVYIDLESVVAGQLTDKKKVYRKNAPSRAQRLLKNNDVIYQIVRPYQRNNFFFNLDDGDSYVASTGYAQLRSFCVSEFLYQLVHTDSFVGKVISKCTGSSYPAINSSDLAEIDITIPSPPEQQKIADCLSSIDELIATQSQKLDALQMYKKGLLQTLFPAEGETIPKLRFSEFQDAPEWEEKRLEDVLSLIVRQKNKPTDPYTGLGVRSHGKGTFLKHLEIPEKNSMEYLYEVQNEDLIVNITFAWEGAIAIAQKVDTGALVSHRFPTYTFKRDVAIPEFFQYVIVDKQFVYKLGVISPGGAGRNRVLNRSDFLKLTILLPQDIDEQQKIADSLSCLNEQIDSQNQKLDVLKAHKKGLMQQLFPSPDEV